MRILAATCIFMVTLGVMRAIDALCYDSADCGSSGCCTLGMAIWLLKKILTCEVFMKSENFSKGNILT